MRGDQQKRKMSQNIKKARDVLKTDGNDYIDQPININMDNNSFQTVKNRDSRDSELSPKNI